MVFGKVKEVGAKIENNVGHAPADPITQTEQSRLRLIGASAFCNCVNLKTVEFPSGLVEIGKIAFKESGIENVTTPLSVRTIR